jgi:hypothetical protein
MRANHPGTGDKLIPCRQAQPPPDAGAQKPAFDLEKSLRSARQEQAPQVAKTECLKDLARAGPSDWANGRPRGQCAPLPDA